MEKHHPDCQLHNLILHDLQPIVDEEGEALLISFGKGQTAKRRETGHLTRGKRFLLSVKKPKYSLFEKLQKSEEMLLIMCWTKVLMAATLRINILFSGQHVEFIEKEVTPKTLSL